MNYRNRFLIGLAAAAITFTSLMAFVGPQRFAQHRKYHYGYERHCSEKAPVKADSATGELK